MPGSPQRAFEGCFQCDLLLDATGEASRTALQASGDLLVRRPVGMTGVLAGPDRRYSYPRHGDSELLGRSGCLSIYCVVYSKISHWEKRGEDFLKDTLFTPPCSVLGSD